MAPTPPELEFAIVRDPLIVTPEAMVKEAIAQMGGVRSPLPAGGSTSQADDHQSVRSGCVVVVQHERVVGLFTEQDVVHLVAQQTPLDHLTVGQVMMHPVFILRQVELTDLWTVMYLLQQHHCLHAPLVDEQERLIGLVTCATLQRAIALRPSSPAPLLHLARVEQAELERYQTTQALQQLTVELEARVQRRTAQLQERETQLQDFLENAHDLIQSVLLENGRFEYVNRAWRQTLGYAEADVQTLTLFDVLHPDCQDHCRELLAQIRAGTLCAMEQVELTFMTKTGKEIIVEGNLNCRLEGDRPVAIRTIFRNMTDRKRIEAALRDSEAQFRDMADNAPTILWVTDATSYCYYFSRSWYDFTGQVPETSLGWGWLHTIHPDDRDYIKAADLAAHQTPEPFRLEYRLRHSDGDYRWVIEVANPWFDADGGFKGYIGSVLDISDRKAAEEALRASEQRYLTLTVAAPVGIFRTDAAGHCVYVNQRWCNIAGLTPTEAAGCGWLSALHPDDRARVSDEWYRCAETGELFRLEYRFLRPDGRVTWVVGQAAQETDRNGGVVGYIGTVTDISDRKQYEAQLQHTNEELARATRLKDEFLANMSHELRTPLNAILGMTEGLQEKIFGELNERQLNALETIKTSGSHLLELINDILDIAKIEADQLKLDCALTSVHHLCQSSLAFVRQQALKKQIQLATHLPTHLPALWVDERRIRQVLVNLLTNAVKFTPEGGKVTLTASLIPDAGAAASTHSCLQIAVIDTGIGIAPADLSKLFQAFVQIDSALNRQYEGTGLGLSLVKRLVELHGGQVGVTSEVGRGSCFTIQLPCTATTLTACATEPHPQPYLNPSPFEPGASPLILLAEDNVAIINTISSYLEARGCRLLLAKNGREAIALAQSKHPDMILMDIQMPEMDGLAAIQQIRRDPACIKIPIIALTALAMAGDRDRCLAAGANEYLMKPVQLKQLLTTIQQLLAR